MRYLQLRWFERDFFACRFETRDGFSNSQRKRALHTKNRIFQKNIPMIMRGSCNFAWCSTAELPLTYMLPVGFRKRKQKNDDLFILILTVDALKTDTIAVWCINQNLTRGVDLRNSCTTTTLNPLGRASLARVETVRQCYVEVFTRLARSIWLSADDRKSPY